MSGYRMMAAMLAALADWADDSRAAGQPPAWICDQVILALLEIAMLARMADKGDLFW